MSLAGGRSYLAIPGPSVLPERVLNAMHRDSPDIYHGALVDMMPGLLADLRALARTAHHVAIYIANGHGTWEAALANVLGPGDLALVLATGPFGHGWAEMATALGIEAEIIDFGLQSAIDPDRVAARLAGDKAHRIKAVFAVHVDTGTSVKNDIAALRQSLDAAGHPELLLADCIASMGCDRFEMDAWGVDLTVAASQKGLMCPPGLGFVYFNQRADAARRAITRVSRYWDWLPRTVPDQFWEYWDGTAPTHHLFALREALDMIAEEGLETAWDRHAHLARAYWAAFETWDVGEGGVQLNVREPAIRAHGVTALSCPAPQATALRDWVREHTGVTLGIGLGMAPFGDPAWHGYFRVGHMGQVNAHMVLGVVGAIKAGLGALGFSFNPGGAEAAAKVVASA